MNPDVVDWNEDLPTSSQEEYQALLRSLRRRKGFGLLFVQSSPATGERLIADIRKDLPAKTIEVLDLKEPITNLYDLVDRLPNKDQINILFIQGLEYSLYDYEANREWKSSLERYTYSWTDVPRILNHLNLQRERFRDNFGNICFVFIVPLFVLKYFIQRAPDFFDWRSGIYIFADSVESPQRFIWMREFSFWWILRIIAQFRRGSFLKNLKSVGWWIRGNVLQVFERYEEAIACYTRALKLKSDFDLAWSNKGEALYDLKRYEEAVVSFDRTLCLNANDSRTWGSRGCALAKLGRDKEALASFDKVLEIQPHNYYFWKWRGIALRKLGRCEEAIFSLDQALKIKPPFMRDYRDLFYTWEERGIAFNKLKQYAEAISSLDQALKIKPPASDSQDLFYAWRHRGAAMYYLERYVEAITCFDEAMEIKPNSLYVWRGLALAGSKSYEKAIASFDKAIEFKSDNHTAWYRKACCYASWGDIEKSIENLQQAIELDPKWRESAKTDAAFDAIRSDARFQSLIGDGE